MAGTTLSATSNLIDALKIAFASEKMGQASFHS